MTKETIKCPKCGEVIELSEAISHDIEIRLKQRYEKEIGKIQKSLEEKAKKEAQESVNLKISDLNEQLKEKTKNLEEAQKHELELRKRQRELEEKEEKLELELSRKIDAERQKIIEKATKEFEETHRLKDAEKDKQLGDMKTQIDELKSPATRAGLIVN